MALDFVGITFENIKNDVEFYLKSEHNKAGILYSNASPYGQILGVLENLHQLSFMYLKNSLNQFDLGDPNSLNRRYIRNAAVSAGHSPAAVAATAIAGASSLLPALRRLLQHPARRTRA